MDHDGDADGAGGEAPRILPHELLAAFCRILQLHLDAEHLGKVLAQHVTCPPLRNASSILKPHAASRSHAAHDLHAIFF